MSRIFWDTMLFIYLLEGHKKYAGTVQSLLARSYHRGDVLLTSYLALAEMLVAAGQPGGTAAQTLISTIEEMGFTLVESNRASVEPFSSLRRQLALKGPDAMHLACAASTKTDLFLTGDAELLKKRLRVPGIQFITSKWRHSNGEQRRNSMRFAVSR